MKQTEYTFLRFIMILGLIIFSLITFSQNKHLSIGYRDVGICLGNSKNYSGLRLNIFDRNVKRINGINIIGFSEDGSFNGISIGFSLNHDSVSNGISLGLIGMGSKKMNGIAFGTIGITADKHNGIGIAGLGIAGDTLNGIFISLIGNTYLNFKKIGKISGITIGIIVGANATKMNGLSIGAILNNVEKHKGVMIAAFNRSEELHGIQFGLLNYAGNNKKFFRWMPLINFNFKKKPAGNK